LLSFGATVTNQTKQQITTLHIGTHILSESSKDNAQLPTKGLGT
jgi:insecticidal toxin complex protein TccC